jgi:hypothetical protein
MCSEQQVKNMVELAFNEEGGLRSEIKEDIRNELKLAVFQVLAAVGGALILAIIGFTIYITSIKNDVDSIKEFIEKGELVTASEAELLQQQISQNQTALESVARRDDLLRIENTLIRLDERLRNQGI